MAFSFVTLKASSNFHFSFCASISFASFLAISSLVLTISSNLHKSSTHSIHTQDTAASFIASGHISSTLVIASAQNLNHKSSLLFCILSVSLLILSSVLVISFLAFVN